jgi:hypothetical protein
MPAYRRNKTRVFLHGGEHEGISSFALADRYSPEGSQNMRLAKLGILRSVGGYSTLNAAAITTDTGASAVKVVGLHHYISRSAGAATLRQVAVVDDGVDEYEIWHSTDGGATWSFLKDMGSGGVGLKPSFGQWENTLQICFGGTLTPQEYDGSAVTDSGPASPPAKPTVALGGTPPGITGTFRYKSADIDANGDVGSVSPESNKIVANVRKINVTRASEGAGGYRLYRTTGDGSVYFWHSDHENGSSTPYIDFKTDRDLLENSRGSEPNVGVAPIDGLRLVAPHRARVFYAGTNDNPNRLYYSDVGNGNAVGPSSFLRIGEGEEGDEITALFPEYEGELLIFKEDSIWRLAGDGRQTFDLVRTQAQKGTIAKASHTLVRGGSKFTTATGDIATIPQSVVVYMTDTDARITDGVSDTVISWAEADSFATLSYQHRNQAWCVDYPPYNWVIFAIPTADGTYTYRAWDYEHGTWHPLAGFPNAACAALTETASAANVLMTGQAKTATGGETYQFFTGNDLDGSNMTSKVRTRVLDFGGPDIKSVLEALEPVFEAAGSSLSITINVYEGMADTGASAFFTTTTDIQGSNVNYVNPDPIYVKTNGIFALDEGFVLEFTYTGTSGWGIAGWTATHYEIPQMVRA